MKNRSNEGNILTSFVAPKSRLEGRQRQQDCHKACQAAFIKLIEDAVAIGWRREELALEFADLADDYVVFLANAVQRDVSSGKPASNVVTIGR